jgi:phospholipase C
MPQDFNSDRFEQHLNRRPCWGDNTLAMYERTTEPSWVASVVNPIGNSSYWENATIIVTWDDWGGWYDHVCPSRS